MVSIDTFRAGDSFELIFDLDDYPASEGWGVELQLRGPSNQDITGSIEDGQYKIEATPAETTSYTAGDYWAFIRVSLAGDVKTIDAGQVTILPTVDSLTNYDGRSHVKRTLDAIESLIEGKASKDVSSYSIGGRALSRMSIEELLKWQSVYQSKYNKELAEENRKNGKASGNRILASF